MAKARSPAYPAIGLKEAVDYVSAVYKEDYQNPITRLVAAEHMGYKGLNGKSLGVLSALVKYGLLEGRGDDTKVSDLAVKIIAHIPGDPERVQSLREAAERPELFSELDQRFQGGRASDQAIRSYLITQKFIPAAADAAIRSYRETKQLVDGESGSYTSAIQLESPKQPPVQPVSQPFAGSMPPPPPLVAVTGNRFDIAINEDRLQVAASLMDQHALDALLKRLEALRSFLPAKLEKDGGV